MTDPIVEAERLLAGITPGDWSTVGATRVWRTGEGGGAICIVAEPEIKTSSDFREVDPGSERWDEAMSNAAFITAAPRLIRTLLTSLSAQSQGQQEMQKEIQTLRARCTTGDPGDGPTAPTNGGE
jgi:hypothetical protein